MVTYYETRISGDSNQNHKNASNSRRTVRKAPPGYVLLYQNSTYSNTMKPCVYICNNKKVWWNGGKSVDNHNKKSHW
jgi:hypothetical protein